MADWKTLAACAGSGTNLFFPSGRYAVRSAWWEEYSEDLPCKNCTVRQQCEQYADENKIVCGIWGGKLYSKKGKIGS